jgi:cytochrome P450
MTAETKGERASTEPRQGRNGTSLESPVTAGSDTFLFDPWDVSWRDDRTAETADQLVENHPVYRLPDGKYVISRYEDVKEILGNHDLYTARPNQEQLIGFPPRLEGDQDPEMLQRLQDLIASIPFDLSEFGNANVIVGVDPPLHTRIRAIVARGFVPRRIRALGDSVDAIVKQCLDGIETASTFEVNEKLAVPVPIRVIGDILGLPVDKHPDLKRWSDVLSASVHGPERGTAGAAVNLIGMLMEFAMTFMPLIEARRQEPGDDLISDMVRAEEGDTLTLIEAVLFLIILMGAANETTTSLIGNTITYLLQNPDQLKLVIEDPSLVAQANEEALRLCAPVQFVYRENNVEVELQGVTIPAGSPLICMIHVANRDKRQYPDPHRFDVTRKGHHLAFGHGVHVCLGAHLGRVEANKAIEAIVAHLPDFELDSQVLRLDRSAFTRAFDSIPLTRKTS